MNPYNEYPRIIEIPKVIYKNNPISGHSWSEHGETQWYKVVGGGWMPDKFRSKKKAEMELNLRIQIMEERKQRGYKE